MPFSLDDLSPQQSARLEQLAGRVNELSTSLGELVKGAYDSLRAVADELNARQETIRGISPIGIASFTYTHPSGSTVSDGYLGFGFGGNRVEPVIGAISFHIQGVIGSPQQL
jgi:hypothetical protein